MSARLQATMSSLSDWALCPNIEICGLGHKTARTGRTGVMPSTPVPGAKMKVYFSVV